MTCLTLESDSGLRARKNPTNSIGTTSKATPSKPLTVSRVFAVHKSEPRNHDLCSVFVGVVVGNDLHERGYCYWGFNDVEIGSGLLSHAGETPAQR